MRTALIEFDERSEETAALAKNLHVDEHGPFKTHKASALFTKKWLLAIGANIIEASLTQGGNCVFCGESGRCPGFHAIEKSTIK